jgi:predicted negative regulator of RcsB-dependent stress response
MASENTASATREIDEVLSRTEVGSFIAGHRSLVIAILVIVFASIAGYGIWSWTSDKRNVEFETAIYEYSQGSLKSFSEKAIEASALLSGYERLADKLGSYSGIFPIGMDTAKLLLDSEQSAQAASVLKSLQKVAKNPYQRFMLQTHLAVALENQGDQAGALAVLEELVKANTALMEPKVYLDLGRLALALGQNDKARSNLQWVIDKDADAEMTLLARLYMSQISEGQ